MIYLLPPIFLILLTRNIHDSFERIKLIFFCCVLFFTFIKYRLVLLLSLSSIFFSLICFSVLFFSLFALLSNFGYRITKIHLGNTILQNLWLWPIISWCTLDYFDVFSGSLDPHVFNNNHHTWFIGHEPNE